MSEIHQQILQLQEQRKMCVNQVERRDVILKLSENKDYKRIIRDEFMVEDCARYTQNSVNVAIRDPEERAHSLAMAQAAGYLKQYLSVAILQGNTAEETIIAIDSALEDLRALDDSDEGDSEND